MSAHLCLIAWNDPIGRPNCTRTLAYSTAISSTFWRPADLLGGEADGGQVEHAGHEVPPAALGPDQPGRRVGELQPGLLAGLVHRRQRGAGQPGGVALDGEQADAGVGAGEHQHEIGGVAVDHEHLGAGQGVTVARRRRRHLDAGLVPPAGRLGEGERGDRLAAGDAGKVVTLRRLVAAQQQGVGRQHDGREERRAQQRPPHLLEHDAQLDVAEPGPAELLGDVHALQAHLLGHLRPHGAVEAVLGLHLLAHRGFRALGVEERAHGPAQLVLLLGEGEVHGGNRAGGIGPRATRRSRCVPVHPNP